MAVSSPVCPICSGTNLSFQNVYGPDEYRKTTQRAISEMERWEASLYGQLADASTKLSERLKEIEKDCTNEVARIRASEPELIAAAAMQRSESEEDRAVSFINGEDDDSVLIDRVKEDIRAKCLSIKDKAHDEIHAAKQKVLAFREDLRREIDSQFSAQVDHIVSVVYCVNCGHVVGTVSSPHTSRLAIDAVADRISEKLESLVVELSNAVAAMSEEIRTEQRQTREEAIRATQAAREVSATITRVFKDVKKTAGLVNLGAGINNFVSGLESGSPE